MAQIRTRKSGKEVDNPETGRPHASKQNPFEIGMQLSEAYLKLGRSLQDEAIEGRRQLSEATTAFLTAKHELEHETAKRATEAYNVYAKAAQEAGNKEKAQELFAEAYQNYATMLVGLQDDACRRLQDLHNTLLTKTKDTSEHANKLARQHYVDYLRVVQRVYSGIDVDALVP